MRSISACFLGGGGGGGGGLESKMADPRWPPFSNHDVISTPYEVIASRYGLELKHLWTYYLFFKSHCHNLYACEVMGGLFCKLNFPLKHPNRSFVPKAPCTASPWKIAKAISRKTKDRFRSAIKTGETSMNKVVKLYSGI